MFIVTDLVSLSDKNNFFHDLKHAHIVFILVMNLHFNTHEQDNVMLGCFEREKS